MRKIFSRSLIPWLLLTIAGTAPVQAVQPGSYDVEVVIFSYRYPSDNGEQWPAEAFPGTPLAGISNSSEVRELPVGAYRLNGISNGLRQSSNYSVLFHRAWRQPALGDASAVDLPVSARAANGRSSVQGSIRLIRERFLHLDANLQMLPSTATVNPVTTPAISASTPVYSLSEKRRIKSNVLHYFDNPRFGMIAMVTPYYSPEESRQLQEEAETVQPSEPEEITAPAPQEDDQLTR